MLRKYHQHLKRGGIIQQNNNVKLQTLQIHFLQFCRVCWAASVVPHLKQIVKTARSVKQCFPIPQYRSTAEVEQSILGGL